MTDLCFFFGRHPSWLFFFFFLLNAQHPRVALERISDSFIQLSRRLFFFFFTREEKKLKNSRPPPFGMIHRHTYTEIIIMYVRIERLL
jgi:hypothetical protein